MSMAVKRLSAITHYQKLHRVYLRQSSTAVPKPTSSLPPCTQNANSKSSSSSSSSSKVTLKTIARLHRQNKPITVMTAHDFPSGSYVKNAGIDICLVGDSLAMVALGYESTTQVTLDEMLHHCRAVARGCRNGPLLVGDMPFGSYEITPQLALENAMRMIREGRMEAVKMEGGGVEVSETVRRLVQAGIPVMGHVGLTPQRQSSLGGYRVQGKTLEQVKRIYEDAVALQEAGAFSLVLEAIPEQVGTFITNNLSIPTIGIGAGPHCSGQVLVQMDAVGMFDRFMPRFCKLYAGVGKTIEAALTTYKQEVIDGKFPDKQLHCYTMESAEEEERFQKWTADFVRK